MDTTTLKQILLEEMSLYADEGFNSIGYLMVNEKAQAYAVIDFAKVRGEEIVAPTLIVRLIDGQIHIKLDHNSKPLIEALKARSVPENQIVLAYRQDTIKT